MQDISSPTRDRTQVPCSESVGRQVFKKLQFFFLNLFLMYSWLLYGVM